MEVFVALLRIFFPSVKAMPKRRDIELLRIVSAFGIVWFHSQSIGHEVSYGSLIFFLLLSTYLAGLCTQPPADFVGRRAKRLLLPWGWWFLIYGLVNLWGGRPLIPPNDEILLSILAGPSIHLWYLPFMFGCLIIFDVLRMLIRISWLAYGSVALAIVLLLTTSFWRLNALQMGAPVAQYAQALPAVLIGVFFSRFDALHGLAKWVIVLLIFSAAAYAVSAEGVGIPYLVGISAGLFLIVPQNILTSIKIPSSVSQCMLGVYLVHPIILGVAAKMSFTSQVWAAVFAFTLSTALVFLVRTYAPQIARYCT